MALKDNETILRIKHALAVGESKETAIRKDEFPDLYRDDDSVDLESPTAKILLEDYEKPKAFNKIGYSRSLGGFFYQFFFALIGAIILAATYLPFLTYFYPWPESKSMTSLAGILFLVINRLFDIPTGYAIERFIGEYRIKNTYKMVQFIRFYIWYQMITGILLITGFSVFTLYMIGEQNTLIWAVWLMIITLSRQYPGQTSIFLATIKGLQQFNKESYVNFANDVFIRPFFEYAFVFWGKNVLGNNPEIGPLLGIAIGYAIGTYIDDFFSMALAGWYLNQALKPMGYSLKDCIVPSIDRDVWTRSLKFGAVTALPGLIGSTWAAITTLWWYEMVPAYLTLTALSKLADELANLMKRGGGINVKATISEAANNNKKNLTSYYISMSWKFIFFFMFALGLVVIAFMPLLMNTLFTAFDAENYLLAAGFLIPNIIATTIEEPQSTANYFILGANRPWFNTIMDIAFGIAGVALLAFWLFVLNIGEKGIGALVWFIPLWGFPLALLRMWISWRYIHRKIAPVKMKEFSWQTFIAPLIASLIVFGVAQVWNFAVFPNLVNLFANWVDEGMAMFITTGFTIIFGFVVCLLLLFFPLYGYFGGWDKNSLDIFNEAVEISGPSKFLFKPIQKATNWLVSKSPFHDKHVIQYGDAMREANELMMERHIKDKLTSE